MRAIFRTVIGAIFGVMAAMVLSPALAAFHTTENNFGGVGFWVVIAAATALGYFAPTIRRSFGRGFLLVGACFLALPFSAILLSGRAANEVISQASAADQGVAAAGAGIAGLAITGVATFVGLFAGAIFVIIGLVLALGGRREVIVIQK